MLPENAGYADVTDTITTSANVMEAAKYYGVPRVVYGSSIEVGGD